MDVLYVVGPDSGHENRELRWSLRSLERFGRNVGRVVVAGYPPGWLAPCVARLPVERRETRSKFRNIFDCVLAAIEDGAVRGEFLYSSDDHFLAAPFDLDATPFYLRAPILPELGRPHRGEQKYRAHLENTRNALLACGYGARETCVHANTRLHAADAAEALRVADASARPRLGVETTCVFQNVRAAREALPWTVARDVRKGPGFDPEGARRRGIFTCCDENFDEPAFLRFMEAEFGRPSRYEKG